MAYDLSPSCTAVLELLGGIPPQTVVARYKSGHLTAEQMSSEVLQGTGIGKQYAADLLGVARDLLARQIQKDPKAT